MMCLTLTVTVVLEQVNKSLFQRSLSSCWCL